MKGGGFLQIFWICKTSRLVSEFMVGAHGIFNDVKIGTDQHLIVLWIQSLQVSSFFNVGLLCDQSSHDILDFFHLVKTVEVFVVGHFTQGRSDGFIVKEDVDTHS